MIRFAIACCLWIAAALPLHAACAGQDLRPTLSAAEQYALDAAMDAIPYAEGNHWRATRGDEVIHLVGTMHLADPRFDAIAARLAPVIETAGRVLLEMTDDEEQKLQDSLGSDPSMLILQDTSLPELMGDADWALLSEAMRARGMPPFMAAKFQPWYISMLLSMPACMPLDEAARDGLDARIEALADGAGVPTLALEPFDTAFHAFGATPRDTQVAMVRSALAAPEANEDLFATLLAAYFEQAHAQSWQVSAVLAPRISPLAPDENDAVFSQIEQTLLHDRNRRWIPVLTKAAAEADGHILAAFGAAHLSGDVGVLNLLAQDGFTLERMPF